MVGVVTTKAIQLSESLTAWIQDNLLPQLNRAQCPARRIIGGLRFF
jgi:hypothetical protein